MVGVLSIGAVSPLLNLLIYSGNNNAGKVNFFPAPAGKEQKKAALSERCFLCQKNVLSYLLPLVPAVLASLPADLLEASRNSFTWRAASLAGSIATSLSM